MTGLADLSKVGTDGAGKEVEGAGTDGEGVKTAGGGFDVLSKAGVGDTDTDDMGPTTES